MPGDQPQERSPLPASGDGAPEVLFPMKMRPLHDRILVKRVEEEAKTKGGIIIPDTAKEKPQEAKVVAVGSGKLTDEGKKIALEVKKGDRVLFGKYSGSEVQIDGEEHLIIREEDVLAIIE
jgi:chaperonin GroES